MKEILFFLGGVLIAGLMFATRNSKDEALSKLITWMPTRIGHWLITFKDADLETMLLDDALNQIARYSTKKEDIHEGDINFALTFLMEKARNGQIPLSGRRVTSDEYGDLNSEHWEKIQANYWETHKLNIEKIYKSDGSKQTKVRDRKNQGALSKPLYGNLRVTKKDINQNWPKKFKLK